MGSSIRAAFAISPHSASTMRCFPGKRGSTSSMDDIPARTPLSAVLRAVVGHRGVQATVALWVIGYLLVLWLAGRAPQHTALRETLLLIGYAALGQVGGWILGPALGYRPFSFHIAGTVFGCSVAPQRGEMWTWALYNFVVFALLPYAYFSRRYTNTQLNLRSRNR